jgi:DNA (cytosine-5)-methyltransferase 1
VNFTPNSAFDARGGGDVRPRLLDLFCGEGGAGTGYARAGFEVVGVDSSVSRLEHYPFEHHQGDAIDYLLAHGHEYDAIHASPPCTGYSRGTAALPDRLTRYDRLIAAARGALQMVGKPWVIENVEDAKAELVNPLTLCAFEFNLTARDRDGTKLYMKRHRLFESSFLLLGAGGCSGHARSTQVAGAYGGARRDKHEARFVRKGGYVPPLAIMRELLGTPWMSEKGCQLSIPPVYTEHIGAQLLAHLESEAAA